jgi:hypothetical protein
MKVGGLRDGTLLSIRSYLKPDVNKTMCSTKNAVASWPEINKTDYRNYTSCKYLSTVYESRQIIAEENQLLGVILLISVSNEQ